MPTTSSWIVTTCINYHNFVICASTAQGLLIALKPLNSPKTVHFCGFHPSALTATPKPQPHVGWKSPSRSSSPTINLTKPRPSSLDLSKEPSPDPEPPEPLGKPQFSHLVHDLTSQRGRLVATSTGTYGISSGSTSARMLMESVLALEVGAAARRIFSKAICGGGQA